MNPRYRRLLIPGLLVALVIVVAIASLAQKADAADDAHVVSHIDDARIAEASGLAVSVAHDDLVYVINDSGNAAVVYAVQLSTGQIVGATAVRGVAWQDSEALSIGADGTLWVADTGDNLFQRDTVALYAFPEPGVGDHVVDARRYPVSLSDGPLNIEAMAINPLDGRIYLISKGILSGSVVQLPAALSESSANVGVTVSGDAPGLVTDAAWAPDGTRVFVRTYTAVHEFDPVGWSSVRGIDVPLQKQGESVAVEPGGTTLLLGSEGSSSPILRVSIPPTATSPAPTVTPTSESTEEATVAPRPASSKSWWWIVGGGGVGVLIGLVLVRQAD